VELAVELGTDDPLRREDEDGRAHYLLDCVLLDEPPKRRSVTAAY
jgi:hypothetical protein